MLAPLAFAIVCQTPAPPIAARDGDTIVYTGNARVRIVHRTEGNVRAIYNAAHHWLVLLVDTAGPSGAPPDGRVDATLSYEDLEGAWPLGERWEGRATIDEYLLIQGPQRVGVGITTSAGLVQMFYRPVIDVANAMSFREPAAVSSLTFQNAGTRTSMAQPSFDQAEREGVQFAELSFRTRATISTTVVRPGFASGATPTLVPGSDKPQTPALAGSGLQPVRVGGSIGAPQKIVDAQPVYPAIAQSARVQGVVILEIVVGADGSVTDARVLRSIPLLDQAAIDCVRKWKYEPTQLNGTPVPVILTVTVNFTLQEPQP